MACYQKILTLCVFSLLASMLPGAVALEEPASPYSAYDQFPARAYENGMVVAQEKRAAEVGREILQRGGNAVDAAVATGFALAVTHPQAGNLGGGGFMVVWLAQEQRAVAIDFREMAPAAARRDMYLDEAGQVDGNLAQYSHLSAGVPGSVMGMTHALEKYGTMPLREVIAPAIRLAERGYLIPQAHADSLRQNEKELAADPSSVRYFLQHPDGTSYKTGDRFVQKDLARTLKDISRKGAKGFYEGRVAGLLIDEMARGGGLITAEDLAGYQVIERAPIQGSFGQYEVISMPPPSSGGIHIVQMLNILEGYDGLAEMGHNSAEYLHRLIEAMRRAYADRAEYLGDADFYPVPVQELTNKSYANRLRGSIDPARASKSLDIRPGLEVPAESPQTTHYSVMDKAGNTVAVTTTLNFSWGSGYSVDGAGFLLNNEMDDFSARPGVPNGYGLIGGNANSIEPGKRPLSSMSPTILLKDGQPFLVTGSRGGSTIITTVLQVLLNVMVFDMTAAEATIAPRIHHQWLPDRVVVERGISKDSLDILRARGFEITLLERGASAGFLKGNIGRTETILFEDGYFYGAMDNRGTRGYAAGY